MAGTLVLGRAETVLPDGVGQDLSGFLSRENPSLGQRDPLYARALWLDDGETTLAWVSVDLLAVNQSLVKYVLWKLRTEHRLAPDMLLVSAIHTHSAPATIFLANCGVVDREWNFALRDALVRLIAQAARATQEVRLRLTMTDAPGYSHNRRTQTRDGKTVIGEIPEAEIVRRGPLNTALSVLAAYDAATDRPVAAVVHFACHPVFYHDRQISADWPGRMLATMRARMGADFMGMFVQGACSDVNPVRPSASTEDNANRMGDALAEAALGCIADAGAGVTLDSRLSGRARMVRLPWRASPDDEQLTALLLSDADWTHVGREAQARHLWANRLLNARSRGWWADGVQMPVQVVSLGELAVVALGAEAFTQTALDLAATHSRRPVLVAGYTNEDVGYLPPAEEYPYGGYEIERAFRYYGYPDVFSPEAEERVRREAGDLLRRVAT